MKATAGRHRRSPSRVATKPAPAPAPRRTKAVRRNDDAPKPNAAPAPAPVVEAPPPPPAVLSSFRVRWTDAAHHDRHGSRCPGCLQEKQMTKLANQLRKDRMCAISTDEEGFTTYGPDPSRATSKVPKVASAPKVRTPGGPKAPRPPAAPGSRRLYCRKCGGDSFTFKAGGGQ